MRIRRSRALLAATTVVLVGVGGGLTAVTAQAAAAGCSVTYSVGSQWPSGFTGNVNLTNLGDPLSSWTLTWSFTAGQQISQGWNGTFTQSGAQVRVTNASWNGALGTNATAGMGFNASWAGTNPAPTSFALNGVTCNGTATPAPTTAAPTTPPPTSAPPTTPPPSNRTFTNPLKVRGPDPWLQYYDG
ncbi:cellulose-binding domain-containing protein, partial [Micromonospora sp. CPCC 206061]|uniref:cellulose-binding domain-containing protein n=1 Tax=Micromonospora sp. CPCC 206061 TaxID=3122410 RepID=UPI002FF41546